LPDGKLSMTCQLPPKDIIDYLIAFTPSIITAITAATIAFFANSIAKQQHKTNYNKLRLDLYQRRFAVYESTVMFYQVLIGPTELIESDDFREKQKNFIRCCRESQFLFEKEDGILELLEKLDSESFKITGFKQNGRKVAIHPPTFLDMNNDAEKGMAFFGVGIKELEHKLMKYLDFRQVL